MLRWLATKHAVVKWPSVRLPQWRFGWERPAVALANIVSVVRRNLGRKVEFVESGVFMAESSVELIALANDSLKQVHLVDPWDGNREMQQMQEHSGLGQIQDEEMFALVQSKMAALPGIQAN